MKMQQLFSTVGISGVRILRVLLIVAALAQLSLGQSFSISISPSSIVIPPGGNATYTITVTAPSVSSGISFSVTGIPPHSTVSITHVSGSVYSLTIATNRLTPQGEYPFTVTATTGGMSASASATVIVLL